jgi:hypothetical protein
MLRESKSAGFEQDTDPKALHRDRSLKERVSQFEIVEKLSSLHNAKRTDA